MKGVPDASSPTLHSNALLHLPPHLREVCALLGTGLLRLRAHTAEDLARDGQQARGKGESSLHFPPEQSGGAAPQTRRHA